MENTSTPDRDLLLKMAWNSLTDKVRIRRIAAAIRSENEPFGFSKDVWQSLTQKQRLNELLYLAAESQVDASLLRAEIEAEYGRQMRIAQTRLEGALPPAIDNSRAALLARAGARHFGDIRSWDFTTYDRRLNVQNADPVAGQLPFTFIARPAAFTVVGGVAINRAGASHRPHYKCELATGAVIRIGNSQPVFLPTPTKPETFNAALVAFGLMDLAGKKVSIDWEQRIFVINGYTTTPFRV